MSHPMWVRGLKQQRGKREGVRSMSHPMWVRGLKPEDGKLHLQAGRCRILCGCVD